MIPKILADEDAVTPVIGIILMVAITVILAAVITTFVLGTSENVSEPTPEVTFEFIINDSVTGPDNDDFSPTRSCSGSDEGVVEISHNGGPTLEAKAVHITGSSVRGDVRWDDADTVGGPTSEISASDSVKLCIKTDDRIQVTWTSQEGDGSSILSTYNAPDA
jgi:hypothetical protein